MRRDRGESLEKGGERGRAFNLLIGYASSFCRSCPRCLGGGKRTAKKKGGGRKRGGIDRTAVAAGLCVITRPLVRSAPGRWSRKRGGGGEVKISADAITPGEDGTLAFLNATFFGIFQSRKKKKVTGKGEEGTGDRPDHHSHYSMCAEIDP